MGLDSMSYSMMRRRFRNLKKIKSRYTPPPPPPPPRLNYTVFLSQREKELQKNRAKISFQYIHRISLPPPSLFHPSLHNYKSPRSLCGKVTEVSVEYKMDSPPADLASRPVV